MDGFTSKKITIFQRIFMQILMIEYEDKEQKIKLNSD